jgi:hypothetical protein
MIRTATERVRRHLHRYDAKQLLGGFTELARALAAAPDEEGRFKIAVDAAVNLMARCDHAGITLYDRGRLVTRASTDDLVCQANRLQTELGEGPCLDVRRDQNTLVSSTLAVERRWPVWAPRVHAELEVDSMMSLLVYTDEHSFGALASTARSTADSMPMTSPWLRPWRGTFRW